MSTNPVPSTIRLPLFWGSATPGAQTPSAVAQVGLLIGLVQQGVVGRVLVGADVLRPGVRAQQVQEGHGVVVKRAPF